METYGTDYWYTFPIQRGCWGSKFSAYEVVRSLLRHFLVGNLPAKGVRVGDRSSLCRSQLRIGRSTLVRYSRLLRVLCYAKDGVHYGTLWPPTRFESACLYIGWRGLIPFSDFSATLLVFLNAYALGSAWLSSYSSVFYRLLSVQSILFLIFICLPFSSYSC